MEDIILKFAHLYIDGSPCNGCKYENHASCCDRYKECAKRIKEKLESEGNNEQRN